MCERDRGRKTDKKQRIKINEGKEIELGVNIDGRKHPNEEIFGREIEEKQLGGN